MTVAGQRQRPVGQLLREWRERRRLSQLELAIQADISTRHLSFVETGRAMPSRDMVLRLAEHLEVPLRDRNHLLLAAGYAPIYPRTSLDSPALAAVRAAVRQVLTAHQPYPAIAVDRHWHLVEANASIGLFTAGAAAPLLTPPVNALRLALHPAGLAPRIVNLGEWRAHLLGRLRRQVAQSGDPELAELYGELRAYPCDQPEPEVEIPGPGEVVVPLRIRHGDRELAFFGTVCTFGTPLDVTVAELAVESFFPLDEQTAVAVRSAAEEEERRVGSASAR
ncbi:helix-turn-helix transcriptional regulator [Micromonospora sp. WMMD1102]|uniref:helix-turn-helix domain-containing protein n=1 Tax=Micromonospora sp. WMMD1102 TaxID=3016105 RepID=UPI0024152B2C|nr:helix-turn-helix transcriptional regulator [Micromonospora sp. WMMD1102]MDG4788370.1 helix-turn-helix transcriptional regulator [Micromonospora sp. WMMD1102]